MIFHTNSPSFAFRLAAAAGDPNARNYWECPCSGLEPRQVAIFKNPQDEKYGRVVGAVENEIRRFMQPDPTILSMPVYDLETGEILRRYTRADLGL